MKIYEKLLYVQKGLKAPKNQYNKFGDFYYRSCEDILEGVKPLLAEVKAVLLVRDDVVQIGNRFYVKATAIFQDTESPDNVANTAFAREDEAKPKMDGAQVTGSCSSYARKYALNGLFCIDDSKDPDFHQGKDPAAGAQSRTQAQNRMQTQNRTQNQGKAQPQGRTAGQSGKAAVTREELAKLISEADRTGTDISKVCERYKAKTINYLSREQYEKAMNVFRKMETFPSPAPDNMRYDEEQWNNVEMPYGGLPFR